MKRKAVSILCFLALLFSMAMTVHGEDLSSVRAMVNNDKLVTISGRIDGGPGQPINILVHDPDGSLEYMNTCLSGAGGLFNISYTMTSTRAGRYNVTVGAMGAENVAATYFLYGENILEATAVMENGLVRITGTTGAGAGQLITARITAPNGAEEYAGCAVSAAGGDFQLSYALANTQMGKYTVYVGASGLEKPAVCYFLAGVKTEVKAKIDKQKLVTVEGISASPGKPVSVQITDPKGITEYLAGVLTKMDGTFAISYTMVNETKGYYTVSVSTKGLDTPVKTEFLYGNGLTNLTLSNCSLTPEFNSETLNYSAMVNGDIASVQVTPTAIDPTAVIKVNNAVVKSGTASEAIGLNNGTNVINITVTAADGDNKAYSVTITRNVSENNNLKGLTISRGTLRPSFSADTTSYTATVPNSVSSIKVTPTASEPTAVIQVNNTVVKSGTASKAVSLEVGDNTITILVEAPSKAQKIYEITVTRDAPSYKEPSKPSSNANLSGLMLNDAVLAPLFSSEVLDYTANVPSTTASVTVTPQTANGNATVTVNNIPVVSGSPSGAIQLNPGSNEISVVVTAENGSTKTYTVTVTRAVLYSITVESLSNGTILADPMAAEAGATINLTITPEAGWQLKTDTLKFNDGADHLITGTSFIMPAADVTVTAEFEQTASGNANLSDLTLTDENLNSVSLNEAFSPEILDYTANVNYLIASVIVTPTVEDSNSTVTVVNNGVESQNVMLNVGNNTITVTVTAEDGSTRSYTINVIRAAPDNAGLLNLAVSTQHPVSPAPFDPDRLSPNPYTVSVPNNIVSLQVIATPVNPADTVEVIAEDMEDDGSINLDLGANNIGIKVTSATDGSVKLYLLIVTREDISNDATLREILVSNGIDFTPIEITPEFDMDTVSYSATVEASVSEITVIAEATHPNADVTINGDRIINVPLNEGENIITILVTAEDDSTTKTYTLTVTKLP